MASITIRQLDDGLKRRLRLRAARHGRSMEDEARTILRQAAAAEDGAAEAGIPKRRSVRGESSANELARAPAAKAASVGTARVLLIVGGGIAAYKSLELIRRLKERGLAVRCVLTAAAQEFITPLSAGALAGERAFTDLFDPASEFEVGHIRLAREADLVVVAPATADLMAKMAGGHADDLASAVLLAAGCRTLLAPAMNPQMWEHPATRRNLARLVEDGIAVIGPNTGEMAEAGEAGIGRMAEPLEIVTAALPLLDHGGNGGALADKRIIVTSGPTHEPIDPVRYIANRSSGKQGHAIAAALARLGAEVTLVSGPVAVADPTGVKVVKVDSADEMLAACVKAGAVDVVVCAAAVADWKAAKPASAKIKKKPGAAPPSLELAPNPDILATLSRPGPKRPVLVVGFAAETENLVANAIEKRTRKGCDWIVANDVSTAAGTFGGERNTVHLISAESVEDWPTMAKDDVALRLAGRIALQLGRPRRAAAAE
jgi:phosphopantothenoylcysteine decarboxylase/phosphopantothenate--cysteine ligase